MIIKRRGFFLYEKKNGGGGGGGGGGLETHKHQLKIITSTVCSHRECVR